MGQPCPRLAKPRKYWLDPTANFSDNQSISSGQRFEEPGAGPSQGWSIRSSKTMLADIQFRTAEIEQLIASNELNTATKRVMDFVVDFGVHRNRKKEAIDLRARYNALREDLRRDVTCQKRGKRFGATHLE
jgi:hypothetical protein